MKDFLEKCRESVLEGDSDRAFSLASRAVDENMEILKVVDEGFVRGIREVGRLWEEGEWPLWATCLNPLTSSSMRTIR